jgi:FkbM family methyltransferase
MNLYNLTPLRFLKIRFLIIFFKKITRRSSDIFVRGGDIISLGPLIFGVHEETLTKYIDNIADKGSSDFFIDIGANIGLTSSQNGVKFKRIFCFEPNPLCVNILKTNLAISLTEGSFKIFDFALGDEDGEFNLHIPKHNWGGAFIKSNNEYPDDVLGQKDGFKSIDRKNYLITTVQVKNAEVVFKNLFSLLISENLQKGVIKIDVEGYEKKVLIAIAKSIPPSIEATIVFENHDPEFDIDEIQNAFIGREVNRFKFERSVIRTKKSKIRQFFEFLIFGDKTKLGIYDEKKPIIGDIILRIK